jgi:RNA polymerase sigma factor (sigma-70 family)
MGNRPSARPIVRWLESLCGFFHARPTRPARVTRIALETLEGRCVMSGVGGSLAAYVTDSTRSIQVTVASVTGGYVTNGSSFDYNPAIPSLADGGLQFRSAPGQSSGPERGPDGPPATPETTDTPAEPDGGQVQQLATARFGETPAAIKPLTVQITTGRVVTPSLAPVRDALGSGSPAPPAAGPFRLARSPADDAPLVVRYNLTAFSGGSAVGRDRAVTLAPGSAHADVPNDVPPGGHEVVTLTVLEGDYQVARPSVSLFLAGDPSACSDLALVGAYRRGHSNEAFAALVDRNRAAVLRTCYRVLGNWHDAEDVSQFVFLALGTRALRLQSSLAGWLRTVAHNASIALLRSRGRRSRHERVTARPLAAPEDPTPELREEIDVALERLSEPLREAVRLRYLEGWSQHEAADLLGCPRGTLSQRASAGVRQLRDVLGAEGT